jgi:hypothetical protein
MKDAFSKEEKASPTDLAKTCWIFRSFDEEQVCSCAEMSHGGDLLSSETKIGILSSCLNGWKETRCSMAKPTLLPNPMCLHLKLLDAFDAAITAVVMTTTEDAECPLCHRRSTRIHSRSVQEVADLPWMGCAVHLELHVRRFSCSNQECVRQIFTERVPTVVADARSWIL